MIAELHETITGEELKSVTVVEFVESWLDRKKPETAASTLTFYRGSSGKFLEFLGADRKKPIAEITAKQVLAFRNHEAKSLAAKTVNHDLKCLKMLFKAAKREGLIAEDPTEFVDTIRNRTNDSPKRRPFRLEELEALIAAADGEWKSMIMFGLYTGQRLGDVAKLLRGDIDLERKQLTIVTSKTNRRLAIPLAPPLIDFLKKTDLPDEFLSPLHPNAHDIFAVQKKSGHLSNQFARILAKAGLREKASHKSTGKGRDAKRAYHPLSFHSLRHTATTLLHEAGVPASVAQALIGHDSEAIHQVYVSVGENALEQAAASFPTFSNA